MYKDLKIAGFGGQGIMLIGQILAYAGMLEGKKVLWIPSYGPEMRGGSANCTVIISDEEIGSPVVSNPEDLILMNQPSLERFEPDLKPGGLMVLNQSLINRTPRRTDLKLLSIPATEVATELGNPKVANMVILGAYLEASKLVSEKTVHQVIHNVFKEKEKLIPINLQALERGAKLADESLRKI